MPFLLVLVIFGGVGVAREYLRSRRRAADPNDERTVQTVLHLLWTFSQLSVLGFGGGKGIIPQMHADAVDRYHWVTSAAVHAVLYHRQAGAGADHDFRGTGRIRRDAGTASSSERPLRRSGCLFPRA